MNKIIRNELFFVNTMAPHGWRFPIRERLTSLTKIGLENFKMIRFVCEYFSAVKYFQWLDLSGMASRIWSDSYSQFVDRFTLVRLDWVTMGEL